MLRNRTNDDSGLFRRIQAHSKVGPGGLKGWVVLLRVEVRVVTWRQRSKQVARNLITKDVFIIGIRIRLIQ